MPSLTQRSVVGSGWSYRYGTISAGRSRFTFQAWKISCAATEIFHAWNEDLVRRDRGEERRPDEPGAPDRHVRILVLERAAAAEGRVEDDHRGVLLPRRLAEYPGLGGHRFLELPQKEGARRSLELAGGIAREPVPDPVDLDAVQVESADEERHVDQVVIVPGVPGSGAGGPI